MIEKDANGFLYSAMQTLLELRSIWSMLHAPGWGGCSFHGDARAVDWRLNLTISKEPFVCMSIHEINTQGRWTYGHNHEQGFVSFIVSGEYESRSWHSIEGRRVDERLERHHAGAIVPFADTERFHSLRSDGPVRTIVLWMPPVIRVHAFDASLPIVESRRFDEQQIRAKLDEVRDQFMHLRMKMRRLQAVPDVTVV